MAKFTGYLGIFREKLERIRGQIRRLDNQQDNPYLTTLRAEARDLEKMLSDMEDHSMVQVTCPHCDTKFRVDSSEVKLKEPES